MLAHPRLVELANRHLPEFVARSTRGVLNDLRTSLKTHPNSECVPVAEELADQVVERVERASEPVPHRAINGTGIVLHTGLGRARLAWQAMQALINVGNGHCALEINADTGDRGSRQDHVRDLLCELTGAESAAVVNNCAGAVLLLPLRHWRPAKR